MRIEAQEKKLDDLLKTIGEVKDDELKAHLSRYFCILISGYLENALKTLVANYAEGSSQKPVTNYLITDLKNVTNLSEKRIMEVLGKFSDEWKEAFKDKASERQLQSLNSIISNRNSIAHGQQSNISYRDIQQYYTDVKGVAEILKGIIKK